jgi:hypothetical protein
LKAGSSQIAAGGVELANPSPWPRASGLPGHSRAKAAKGANDEGNVGIR